MSSFFNSTFWFCAAYHESMSAILDLVLCALNFQVLLASDQKLKISSCNSCELM